MAVMEPECVSIDSEGRDAVVRPNGQTIFVDFASGEWLNQTLKFIAGETVEHVLTREKTSFDQIASSFQNSLVLFGAGALGRFVLKGLRKAGVEPIAFADNDSRLWGARIDDLPILSPTDAVSVYTEACFVVTVYHGAAVTRQLRSLGCERIAPVAPLYWKYPDIFIPSSYFALPHEIVEQDHEIRAGYEVLSDDISRREFCEQILWRFRPDTEVLSPHLPEHETYFPDDLVAPLENEVFVDCGAFDGDSVRSFLAHRDNKFGKIYAVEPDPGNLEALRTWAASLEEGIGGRIVTLPYGISDRDATVFFRMTNTVGSTLLTDEKESSIECRKLDTLIAEMERPTYIKMDIEGAEPRALAGGADVLRSSQPVLAICVYHRCEHIWQIPSLIHSIFPGYRIFLRRYAEDCWEIVCYAVPPGRLVRKLSEVCP